MEPILSENEVIKFLSRKGGKSTNHELVSNFKGILNDPVFKVEARLKFKDVINTVAKVEEIQGVKYIKLKNEFYNPSFTEEIQSDIYDSPTDQTSSGYTSPYSQGYQPYWRYRLSSSARQLSIAGSENNVFNESPRSRSSSSGNSVDLQNTYEVKFENSTDRTRLVSRNHSITEYGSHRSESNSPQRTRTSSNSSSPRHISVPSLAYPSTSPRERASSCNEVQSRQESLYWQQEPLRQNFYPSLERQNFSPTQTIEQSYTTSHKPQRHSINDPQEKQFRQNFYSSKVEPHYQNSYYQDEPLYENLGSSSTERISPPQEVTRNIQIPSQDLPQQKYHSPQISTRPSSNISHDYHNQNYFGSHESLDQNHMEHRNQNYKASQEFISQRYNSSKVTRHSSFEQSYCSPDQKSVRQSSSPLDAESVRQSSYSLDAEAVGQSSCPFDANSVRQSSYPREAESVGSVIGYGQHLTLGLPLVVENTPSHEIVQSLKPQHSNSTSKTSLSTRHCDKVESEIVKQSYSDIPDNELSHGFSANECSIYHKEVKEIEKTETLADKKKDNSFTTAQDSCDKKPRNQDKVEGSNKKEIDLKNNSNNENQQLVNGLVKQRVRHIDDIEKHKSAKKSFLNVSAGKENTIVKTHGMDDETSVTMIDSKLKKLWFVTAAQSDYHGLVSLLKKEPKLAGIKDIASGYTALHWAAKHGDANVVKLIAGAYRVNPNIRSNGGYTSIHLAALHKHEPIVHLLVHTYGGNPAIRDYSGKKANQYPNNYLDVVAGVKKMERKPLKPRPVVKEPSGVFIRIGSLNLRKSRRSAVFASVRSTGRLKNWNSSDSISETWKKSSSRSSARVKKSTKNYLNDKKSDTDSKNGSDSDSAYGFHQK